jgi:4-alpha-glucanotransferase
VQFVADEQLVAAGRAGAGLYLDLPIGVHPDGYDTWAYDGDFADAGVGAPPDPFFAGGQSWGFPPLHPEAIRRSGYRYLIEAYRQAFRHASVLRIDHVPGLHRMFWIPPGGDATTGAYVRYRHEELRALIAIEAHRVDARVVGEDLGTVTPAIRNAMDRDGMLHSFITRFAATVDDPLPQPRVPSAASVGSQDLPRFAAYWCGNDIDDRLARGEIDESTAMADRRARDALVAATAGTAGLDPAHRRAPSGIRQALQASLDSLATGPAALVLADLADLLGEQVPDNRPGTGPEADNWRWRLPRRLGEIAGDSEVVAGVARITRRRTANAMEGAIG